MGSRRRSRRRPRRRTSQGSEQEVSSGGSVTAVPPVVPEGPPAAAEPGVLRRNAVAIGFLAPAAILLGVWILYPTVYTIGRSFFGPSGFGDFVWIDNYKAIFTTSILVTAIKNSIIWILVA